MAAARDELDRPAVRIRDRPQMPSKRQGAFETSGRSWHRRHRNRLLPLRGELMSASGSETDQVMLNLQFQAKSALGQERASAPSQ